MRTCKNLCVYVTFAHTLPYSLSPPGESYLPTYLLNPNSSHPKAAPRIYTRTRHVQREEIIPTAVLMMKTMNDEYTVLLLCFYRPARTATSTTEQASEFCSHEVNSLSRVTFFLSLMNCMMQRVPGVE